MATAKFGWGIDVGNRALKAIKLVRGDGGLRVDDFDVIEHETVMSNAGDNRDSLMESALANFSQRHETKGGTTAISVSGVSSFARFIKLPPVEPKKIPEIVKFEAIQQIPFPLSEVEWDYQLFQPPDSPDVEVGIFAMKTDLINRQIEFFRDVGMDVHDVQMSPLAVYNAMDFDGRFKTGPTMVIDLGAENTDLIIAENDTLWLRSIPIGGNNFTEILAKSFKLKFAKAEELKRTAATSKYARQIFQAMRPVFADLVAEVQRSIGFYSSVHRESRIKKIYALGGAFRLPGLQKYLQQNLQVEVERLSKLSAGAPAEAKLAAQFNENLLSMVTAYGLAIQAMGEGKITTSLLPHHIQRERMWRGKTRWFAAAAGCCVLGTALAFGRIYAEGLSVDKADGTHKGLESDLNKWKQWDAAYKTDVANQGAQEKQVTVNLASMADGHELVPQITADMLSMLKPMPADYWSGDAAKIKALGPRAGWETIKLSDLKMDYYPQLYVAAGGLATAGMPAMAMPAAVVAAQGGAGAVAVDLSKIPKDARGLIVTMTLTTPHDQGFPYVREQVVKALNDMTATVMRARGKGYYVAVAMLDPNGYTQFKDSLPIKQKLQQSWQAAFGAAYAANAAAAAAAATPGGAAAPNTAEINLNGDIPAPQPANLNGLAANGAENPDAYKDRVTGENMLNDWEVTVRVYIVLDSAGGKIK